MKWQMILCTAIAVALLLGSSSTVEGHWHHLENHEIKMTVDYQLKVYQGEDHLMYSKYHHLDNLRLSSCKQRWPSPDGKCERAIDGLNHISCSRVNKRSSYGWWEAKTDGPALIKFVEIYNNEDCCGDALTKFKISVDGDVCHEYDGEDFIHGYFRCFRKGIVLKIETSKPEMSLCEVNALGKLLPRAKDTGREKPPPLPRRPSKPKPKKISREKPPALKNRPTTPRVQLKLSQCRQSTTYAIYTCDRAIDGNTNGWLGASQSCAHIGSQSTGWWMAQTDRDALFEYVEIYNRLDCCNDTFRDSNISVDGVVCSTYKNKAIFSKKTFSCFKKGRKLKISSNKPYLTICEVIATGRYIGIQLKLSKCKQSTTYAIYTCDRAIDGNTNGWLGASQSCAHIGSESTGWWMAQTDRDALFEYVEIYNRLDCCNDTFRDSNISVDGVVCNTYKNKAIFSKKTFSCFKKGRQLKISSNKPYLTICEVIAFGGYY